MDNVFIERLAIRAKLGDSSALFTLCQTIVGSVLFKAKCIMGNNMDAEDVAQESLIRVCTKIKELNDPTAFNSWLGAIIVNEARRQMSKNSKHTALDLENYIDFEAEESEEYLPQESIVKEESRSFVMGAIGQLPERQREAVVLHYYDGMNVTETAKAMGITQQTASQYLKLARDRIKQVIDSHADMGKQESLRAISVAPLGTIMTEVLQKEAEVFIPSNKAATQHALDICSGYIKNTTVKAATGSVASGGMKITAVIVAIAVVASLGALITLWRPGSHGVAETATAASADPNAEAGVVGDIVFSGGDAEFAHVNPKSATPVTNSNYGQLDVQDWDITTLDRQTVLYSGEGQNVDSALAAMRDRGEDGEYILNYSLEDALGNTYVLDSNFLIKSAGY